MKGLHETAIILGTRPEIIKMSPVIRDCEKRGMEHFILHTGQDYSYNMDRVFFERLGLPDVGVQTGGRGARGADGEEDGGNLYRV